jgi:hypothetical protein
LRLEAQSRSSEFSTSAVLFGMCANLRHLVVMNAAAPRFAQVAMYIRSVFEGADILGYNAVSFHVPLLAAEFLRKTDSSSSSAAASDTEEDCDFQVITLRATCSASCETSNQHDASGALPL